jgi:hypothetical protein
VSALIILFVEQKRYSVLVFLRSVSISGLKYVPMMEETSFLGSIVNECGIKLGSAPKMIVHATVNPYKYTDLPHDNAYILSFEL